MSTLRNALRDLPGPVFADLLESDEAYLLVVDLPGVSEDTVEIEIEGPRVRIEARRGKDLPREYRYLQEDRPLFLDADLLVPPDASGAGASATIDRGTLELRLPKHDREGTTSVPIEVRDRDDANAGDGDPAADDDTNGDEPSEGTATTENGERSGRNDERSDRDDA